LIQDGASGPLESIQPPVSPPAWASIQTGLNPGKHGIFDFGDFDSEYRRRSINATDRDGTPFWQILNDHDVSTGLFKVPFTYPPEREVDGFLVTGFPTPDTVDDHAVPASIADRIGTPDRLFEDWHYQNSGEYGAFLENLKEVTERQTDVLLGLLDSYDVNLLMTVYDGTDRLQHFFWKHFDDEHSRYDPNSPFSDAIGEYYELLDSCIGRLLDEREDRNVVILSDHGFGPLESDVYISEWLAENGYLSHRDDREVEQLLSDSLSRVLSVSWNWARRVNVDRFVSRVLPHEWFEKSREIQDSSERQVVWDESVAFFTTLSGQAIFINLSDRFVDGTVAEDEYERVVEELRSSLERLEHPETGEQLIYNVYRSADIFDGWRVDDAPDLILESAPTYTLKKGRSDQLVKPSVQNDNDRSGDHRSEGILIASGPAFESGTVTGASVLDIAPTLLYMHDAPVPRVMDGTVLEQLFTRGTLSERELRHTDGYGHRSREQETWTDSEAAQLEEQLSNMGYLD
jgi:predicted AlkP superfamily phosphohydrolase/phosphomutase